MIAGIESKQVQVSFLRKVNECVTYDPVGYNCTYNILVLELIDGKSFGGVASF